MESADIFKKLKEPFQPSELEWRAQSTGKLEEKNGQEVKFPAFAYIQARAIANRLDNVVGPNNWYDRYEPGPNGGVLCSLSIRIDGEWLAKQGLADNTQVEAVKGGESDSLKRAGYKWGIGRYLYDLPDVWCKCMVKGRTILLLERPALPEFAYPAEWPAEKREKPGTMIPMNQHAKAQMDRLNKQAAAEKKATAQVTDEGKKSEKKADAPAVDKAAENRAKALAYKVPMGHGLPSEGQPFGDVLKKYPEVGLHLLHIVAGRLPEGSPVKPFEPKTEEDQKAVKVAQWLLDHQEQPVAATA